MDTKRSGEDITGLGTTDAMTGSDNEVRVSEEKAGEQEEVAAAVPTAQKGQFMAFLKQIASFSGDLSALTCPSFLLSGVSMIEYRFVMLVAYRQVAFKC